MIKQASVFHWQQKSRQYGCALLTLGYKALTMLSQQRR
jgi:hypothetical protein